MIALLLAAAMAFTAAPVEKQATAVSHSHMYETGTVNTVALRFSHYDPRQGGVNCGDICSAWILKLQNEFSNSCYIAAPPEFAIGATLIIKGKEYRIADRGGYVQRYSAGEYDQALDAVAEFDYVWVDILDKTGCEAGLLSYGWVTNDWRIGE